jgi:hypothetical protein
MADAFQHGARALPRIEAVDILKNLDFGKTAAEDGRFPLGCDSRRTEIITWTDRVHLPLREASGLRPLYLDAQFSRNSSNQKCFALRVQFTCPQARGSYSKNRQRKVLPMNIHLHNRCGFILVAAHFFLARSLCAARRRLPNALIACTFCGEFIFLS